MSVAPAESLVAAVPTARRQCTLGGEIRLSGVGFFTNADVSIRLSPAAPHTGYVFVRKDLPGEPRIPARVANRVPHPRRTVLQAGAASVEMTEHVLAALAGMEIDNCLIELIGPEPPGLDGSALPFVEGIDRVGVETQSAVRTPLVIEESSVARDGEAFAAIHPGPADRLDVTYNLDYGDAPGIGRQSYCYRHSPAAFAKDIAPARTFVRESEVAALKSMGVGLRVTPRDLLVFGADGNPIDNRLRFPDECVRHKILDCIGDLALLGRPACGHVLAHCSGHHINALLAAAVLKREREIVRRQRMVGRPLLDAVQIEQIMPHRYPFMLVDRVIELDPNHRALGLKNVTYNEPFFQGHWPGRPVMPGVLIIEAMAQLAGLMLTQWQESGLVAMIVSLNNIKLRRQVIPGDQLILEAVATRLKARTAVIETSAKVGEELAAEAQLRLVLVDPAANDGVGE